MAGVLRDRVGRGRGATASRTAVGSPAPGSPDGVPDGPCPSVDDAPDGSPASCATGGSPAPGVSGGPRPAGAGVPGGPSAPGSPGGRAGRRRIPRRTWAVVAACLAAGLLLVGALSAKYVSVRDREAEMVAAGFHVSSDTLREVPAGGTAPTYRASRSAEDGTFAVDLYDWEVENADAVSEVDVYYTVTLTDDASGADANTSALVSVTSGGATVPKEASGGHAGSYLLPRVRDKGGQTDEDNKVTHTLAVRPARGASRVTVTVRATAPYSKALSATFDVTGVQVKAEDAGGGVTRLTIVTNSYAGSLALRWANAGGDALHPNAGVNEQSFGWEVGYEGHAGESPSYADGEATIDAERDSTYYFEFVGPRITSVTGTLSGDPVTYRGDQDYPEGGTTGVIVNVS